MLQLLGYVSAAFIVLSFVPYLRDIFKGTTKPERASWFIWSVLGCIIFFSQIAKGASASSLWFTGSQTLGDLTIFLFALKYGFGGFLRRDIVALAAAGLGLVLWYLTNEAGVALLLAIFIDATGALLTIVKSYHHPNTETLTAWLLTAIGGALAVLAVGSFDKLLLAFPLYTTGINLSIAMAMVLGRKRAAKLT